MDNQPAKQTFFISRAGANAEFARWLATELRSEGHETILQDDDFGHQDFMAAMDRALSGPARVVALYSPAYFASEYCKSEGRHPLGRDPSNEQQKLVPLLIEPAHVGGVFQNIAFTDLLNAREQGASVLRDAIWIALGLTPRDPAAAPAPLRKAGWVHREVYSDPRFKGREDLLAAIHTKLQSGDLLAVKALNGTGGVGKTTLAREYAARHQGEYAGVWWIRAESPETMTTDLIELGERYISGLSEKQDRDASVQQALEAIENHQSDRPWLLVYDNVPEPGALEGMTPRRGAQILATSRHTSWQGRAAEVDVDVFAPDVAVAFLLERTGRSDEAGAGEAAERLGHLPLALEQAAGYLSEAPHMAFTGPGGYLSYLDEMITRAPAGMDADRSVFGAVSLSLETASKQHDKAQALFALIAFMDPERIPVSLLQGADGFTDLDLTEALAALARTSLIKHTPFEDGEAAISVHRLSQDVMRARLGQAGGAEDALGAALGLLWRAWPSTAGDVRYWPECDLLVAHVNRVTQLCDDNTAHHAALRGLLGGLDVLHDARAQYAEAEEASRRALKVAEANLEPGDPAIAIRLHNLAALLQATNRLTEAEPLMRRALAIDEASYGPDHPEVATDLNNLAILREEGFGDYEESERLKRRALEIDVASYGESHPRVAINLNNLAQLLQDTIRLTEAEPLMRRALAIDEASYGPDHPNVAIRLNNLAMLLRDTSRLGEAEPLMRQALEIFQASLPEGHPNIDVVAGNLAALEAEIAAAGGGGVERPERGTLGSETSASATPPPLDAASASPTPSPQPEPRRGGPAMIVRQIIGAVLLAVGLWLGWGTLSAFLAYTGRGADAGAALADPVFLVPGIRSGLAILGGLLALVRWPGAAPLAALATFLTALMGGLLALNGADSAMWVDDFIYAAILFLITCGLLLRQRTG